MSAAAQTQSLTQLIAIVIVAAVSITGVLRFLGRKTPWIKQAPAAGTLPWDWVDAATVGLLIFLLPQVVAGMLLSNKAIDSTFYNFLLVLVVEAGTIGMLWVFLKKRGASLRALGFRRFRAKDVLYILAGYGLYFVTLLAVLTFVSHVFPHFNEGQAQDTGFTHAAGASLVYTFFALVVFPPIAEEMLFRGFLYQGFKQRFTPLISAIMVSLLFGVAHAQWNVAIDTFILSMVMIIIFEKSHNLWVNIGLHALKNFIAFAALYLHK